MNKLDINTIEDLDCNCSNCKAMVRDNTKYSNSLNFHHEMQLNYFNKTKERLMLAAIKQRDVFNNFIEYNNLIKEANSMRFQFDKKYITINYGRCDKFNKDVSFIPNTIQLDTQDCFINRRSKQFYKISVHNNITLGYSWRCWYCGAIIGNLKITKDHFYPKSLGGKLTVYSCNKCNKWKSNFTPNEWLNFLEECKRVNRNGGGKPFSIKIANIIIFNTNVLLKRVDWSIFK